MNNVVLDCGEIDDFAERMTDLVVAIVQPEHTNLFAVELARLSAGKREDRLADLDSKLTGRVGDRSGGDFLDPVDDRQPNRTPSAVETTEQQDRNGFWPGVHGRSFGNPGGALLGPELPPADLGQPGWIEQQDRAAVVGERRSSIKSGGHNGRRRWLDDQLLVVVDAVHRQG